jgi:hypothetical protein
MRLEMRRAPKQLGSRRWPPWLRWFDSNPSAAFKQIEKSSQDVPASGLPATTDLLGRDSSGACEWERHASFKNLVRQLLHETSVNPGFGSRLDFCPEFTKPDSLKVRLMGTPKNHRSPPA